MMMRRRIYTSVLSVSLLGLLSPAAEAAWPFKKKDHSNKNVPKAEPVYEDNLPVAQAIPVSLPSVHQQLAAIPAMTSAGADSHNGRSHLIVNRQQDLSGVDACASIPGQKNFLNSIEGAVRMSLTDRQIETNIHIDPPYGLPGTANSQPVSLLSNPICVQDADQIAAILGKEFLPDAKSIQSLKKFSEASNADRRLALQGDTQALALFNRRMTQMMGCLSYEESLNSFKSDEDEAAVEEGFQAALKAMPDAKKFFADSSGNVTRPSGVLFAEDRDGNFFNEIRAAKKNGMLTPDLLKSLKEKYKSWPVVGTYQFNPKFGNVGPCVDQWNKIVTNPACKINGSSPSDVMRALASPGQTFNTFCGVQKVVQAFNSQVNTNIPTGVDTSNLLPNGQIKAPQDRCVSLVARSGAGRIYSHFGPWRNSVKDNMGKLMNCVSNSAK